MFEEDVESSYVCASLSSFVDRVHIGRLHSCYGRKAW